jgi:predicted membrane chloride channel (bestrophin family)
MNTSSQAIQLLQEAHAKAQAAVDVIHNLIAAHDYQDVAELVAKASAALLESTIYLMQAKDEAGLDAIEAADEYLDEVYAIIDAETDED